MSYVKTNWVDGTTPASASNMNNIESGVSTNDTNIATNTANIATNTANIASVTNTYASGWFKDAKTGYLHQWGSYAASGVSAISFYVPYVGVPNVRVCNSGGGSSVWNTITKTGFNISATGTIFWVADGK